MGKLSGLEERGGQMNYRGFCWTHQEASEQVGSNRMTTLKQKRLLFRSTPP